VIEVIPEARVDVVERHVGVVEPEFRIALGWDDDEEVVSTSVVPVNPGVTHIVVLDKIESHGLDLALFAKADVVQVTIVVCSDALVAGALGHVNNLIRVTVEVRKGTTRLGHTLTQCSDTPEMRDVGIEELKLLHGMGPPAPRPWVTYPL
jgi:hypothetical protein